MEKSDFQKMFTGLTSFKENRFHPLVWINGEPEIGSNVCIGGMSEINAKNARVFIGDNCDIASFVAINCADSHKRNLGLSDKIDRKDIILEENVFIGSHSVVKGGAHIGHHSVIAAGTIVEGVYIPPYSLVIGNPMKVKEGYYLKKKLSPSFIAHSLPTLGSEEEQAAIRMIRSDYVTQGHEIEKFEIEFCSYLGLPEGHAVAVSSGSAALYLALQALNVKDQEVAIPSYGSASIRNALAMNNSKEVLIDSSKVSPNIDVNELINSRLNTAVIPHLNGIPINISDLVGINVIEDCSQSLGAFVNDTPVGLQGKMGIYSFCTTQLITSGGQGGMVVSKDKALIDWIRDYCKFDQRSDHRPRFNFQMTDIQAAVGRAQLLKLPAFLERRQYIFNKYKGSGISLLGSNEKEGLKPVRYRAIMQVTNPIRVIEHLRMQGIKVIIPLEKGELLGDPSLFPNALKWTEETVSIPIYPSLEDIQLDRIINAVKEGIS